ncbi:Fic family protein [uncultured Oscillibacter sp.]|uniref:Fic/DOC family protein n=1 Tax=uncultured Oscillibacter sp. TaxID=876091 RepID=UPI0028065A99|nr:Fic family protein [uncultured Oscillibacter sp.]
MRGDVQRDPYLYEDVPILRNLAGIRDAEALRAAEGDLTKLTMGIVYAQTYERFNTQTLREIHRIIFGDLFEWAGVFRTIQMTKAEEVLGGDTVLYASPAEIKKELDAASKEIAKLRRNTGPQDLLFRIVRITAAIWQTHPFREGNTRAVVAFSVLLAAKLGIELDYALFAKHAAYVRNALVWCTQGIYSKFEYLERIYYDAAGLLDADGSPDTAERGRDYSTIGTYQLKNYKEQPHLYADDQN